MKPKQGHPNADGEPKKTAESDGGGFVRRLAAILRTPLEGLGAAVAGQLPHHPAEIHDEPDNGPDNTSSPVRVIRV
ncbi:hypothetical protein [Amycolatopsis taiwanensis]|uniref:Uncharacterized protein n=1 Tax=Amycolatopsis taiwanensis TaxID=342230 RepID=A0A9W6VGB1_9PSEU|nr:hypothetical protein [Amycolatopsis taiwanensis]GLY70583.1 hypothetical protein Atai01_72020 [Amycolatopsis taiwanensis]